MPMIHVIDREGHPHAVTAQDGYTLMEAIREAGVDELLALCGGSCSCATCHVYIEEAARFNLAPLSADEDDLLDSSDHRLPESRLSCQVKLTASLNGLTARIAPED